MNNILYPKFWNLRKLFENAYRVPVYQRPYSWEKEQLMTLLDDIWKAFEKPIMSGSEPEDDDYLYVGNIMIRSSLSGTYDIIDGQQRITTFTIILLALYVMMKERGWNDDDKTVKSLQKSFWGKDLYDNLDKNERKLVLGSIDRETLEELYNLAFDNPAEVRNKFEKYNCNSTSGKFIKRNFILAYGFFSEKTNDVFVIEKIADYILSYICIIVIKNNISERKVFSIFESMNSKGKQLDPIDLIKTRIFSLLDESDYPSYSKKWGDLIIKTNDKIYDYLKIYIKSEIRFYNSNVTYKQFQGLDNNLKNHFKTDNIATAYKLLIDDLLLHIDSFIALNGIKNFDKLISNNSLRYYFSYFCKAGYEHPKPVFFKCLNLYKKEKLSKKDSITIIQEVIKFCIISLSVSARDSKDIIPLFRSICESGYEAESLDKDYVINEINKFIKSMGIKENAIKDTLVESDAYSGKSAYRFRMNGAPFRN